MRLSIPLTAVSLIALIGAAATYSHAQPSQQIPGASLGLTVDALRVIDAFPVRANGARYLQGEFAIRRARAGERYLVNAGTGGACLVAQIPARAGTCATTANVISGPPPEASCAAIACPTSSRAISAAINAGSAHRPNHAFGNSRSEATARRRSTPAK